MYYTEALVPCQGRNCEAFVKMSPPENLFLQLLDRLPKVYQKGPQSSAAQGIGGLPHFRTSTKCLPISLFYIESGIFPGFPPAFRNFRTPRKGRNTDVTGTKDSKISKNLGKTMKIVSKKLNLPHCGRSTQGNSFPRSAQPAPLRPKGPLD